MNYDMAVLADSAERRNQGSIPRSFEMDSILAQQVKAGELLDRLYAIILGSNIAQRALQDEPNRMPELLAFINEQAVESYKALMRAVAFS